MRRRTRPPPSEAFAVRLMSAAREVRAKASRLPLGKERDRLLRKARQVETAALISEWISSPGLRPSK
jgi:hypothetical protein